MLDRFDAYRIVIDVERTSRFARRGTDAAGELGEVVRRVEDVESRAPLPAIREIVPVRNDVVDRTSGLAKRNAAVHAASALPRSFIVGEGHDEFAIVGDAPRDRFSCLLDPLQFDEAGDFPH